MNYKVLKGFSYEPTDKQTIWRQFTSGEEFAYPDKKRFPTKLPIEWLLQEGAIEEVKVPPAGG